MTCRTIYIAQGEEAVGATEDTVISTILGSCISFCLWDPDRRIGGMNHLLLPDLQHSGGAMNTSGVIAIERLINKIVRLGAERSDLRAKLFGGSSMLSGMTDIGARNAGFGRNYLAAEGIPCDNESLGGVKARKLRFWPASGSVWQKFVEDAPELVPASRIAENDVELF